MVRKVALSANLAWIFLILARFAMKGGQVQEPKLMTRGTVAAAMLSRVASLPVRGSCSLGLGAGLNRRAVCLAESYKKKILEIK